MGNELYKSMAAYVDTKADFMRTTRQDFHKHAEAGWHEIRTCSIIADHLIKLGYTKVLMGRECFDADKRMGLPDQAKLDEVYQRALEQGAIQPYAEKFKDGFTCVIAVLETGRPGPVIATRQDIDALGVYECLDPEKHRPAQQNPADNTARLQPEQRGDHDARQHQHSAHAGGAVFAFVQKFRRHQSFVAVGGPEVEFTEHPGKRRSKQQNDKKCGGGSSASPESNIVKQTQGTAGIFQKRQIVKHI